MVGARYPAAMFTASREELLGPEPLLAAPEIARCVCRTAEQMVGVSAISAARVRRIDGWLGAVGFVIHAAATDQRSPMRGSVCDTGLSPTLLGELVGSLVGDVPVRPADVSFEVPALAGLSPVSLPGVDWIVAVAATSVRQGSTRLMIAAADGLLAGEVAGLDRTVRLDPVEPARLGARLAELVRVPSVSVRDLLDGD